jgi:hypothetical protein
MKLLSSASTFFYYSDLTSSYAASLNECYTIIVSDINVDLIVGTRQERISFRISNV